VSIEVPTFEELLAAAHTESGLDGWGPWPFTDGLHAFLDGLRGGSPLSELGAAMVRMDVVRMLTNRLRFQRDLAGHPEILDQQVTAPVVIAGLPRTGTTKLQRMMSADPTVRRLELWKLLNPAPIDGVRAGTQDPRVDMCRATEQMLRTAAPAYMAAHPTETTEPDEEALLLEPSFTSTVSTMRFRVPSFAGWIRDRPQDDSYRYLKAQLQYLQWQEPRPDDHPWILKSPCHLGQLPLLLETFPDALVVQCHRDPREVIPSFASLAYAFRKLSCQNPDPADAGSDMLTLWAHETDRNLEHRAGGLAGDERIMDVSYDAIRHDVIGVITEIYTRAGRPVTEAALAAFDAYDARRPAGHFGTHDYSAEQFGLDPAGIADRFGGYSARFLPVAR
jgi:hypothetical protein